jgi:hypothetical protein
VWDGTNVTTLAMYPKQPFDIAGRTGTVAFDVSDDTQGSHAAWPEFWYTDQPVPAPFTHENTFLSTPRNGLGVRFSGSNNGSCAAGTFSVDSAVVVRNYEAYDTFIGSHPADFTLTDTGCVTDSSGPGNMNHVELRINQNEVDVYATNAGTTSPLIKIATITNANLTLSRGLIWLEDAHYNANKFNGQGTHTFTWDNVGFDGPVLPRDLAFDVLDALTPAGSGALNLGWNVPSDGTALTLQAPGVNNITAASAGLLTFGYWSYDTVTLSYSLNGNTWHSIPWPYPDSSTYSWRTLAVPINLSEVVPGTNTIQFKSSAGADIANVNLIMVGAGGTVAPK